MLTLAPLHQRIAPAVHHFNTARDLRWNHRAPVDWPVLARALLDLTQLPGRLCANVIQPFLCEFGFEFGALQQLVHRAVTTRVPQSDLNHRGLGDQVWVTWSHLLLSTKLKRFGVSHCPNGPCIDFVAELCDLD